MTTTLSTYVERRLLQTDALAIAGAVSCLERSAVHGTRAYYLLFRADCDLPGHMAFRSGSLEFCLLEFSSNANAIYIYHFVGSEIDVNTHSAHALRDIVRNMLSKVILASTIVATIMLAVLLQVTNPSSAGPIGLLAVFFLFYVIMIGITTELLWVGSRGVQVIGRKITSKRPPERLSLKRAYYFSTILALGPVIALGMQSIGTLGVYELILIAVFLAVGTLYVSRRSSH